MRTRSLGQTGIACSELTLGTWGGASGTYGRVERSLFLRTAQKALELGVTTFDMAPTWGHSEETVAEAVGERRDEVVYVTRAGLRVDSDRVAKDFSRVALEADLHTSLTRLKTEHVDVLLMHNPDEAALCKDEWLEFIRDQRDKGTIRVGGVSVTTAAQARIAIARGVEVLCVPYNIFEAHLVEDLASEITASGVGVLGRSPLLYGLLCGRYAETHRFANADHRQQRWDREDFRQRVRQVEQLRFLCEGPVRNLTQAALRFALSNARVNSVVLGARTPVQLIEGASVCGEPPYLPEEALIKLPQVLTASGVD